MFSRHDSGQKACDERVSEVLPYARRQHIPVDADSVFVCGVISCSWSPGLLSKRTDPILEERLSTTN